MIRFVKSENLLQRVSGELNDGRATGENGWEAYAPLGSGNTGSPEPRRYAQSQLWPAFDVVHSSYIERCKLPVFQ